MWSTTPYSGTNAKLADDRLGEPSADIRGRVKKALQLQRQRISGTAGGTSGKLILLCNADMGPSEMRQHYPLDEAGKSLLRAAMTQLGMSARAPHRILPLYIRKPALRCALKGLMDTPKEWFAYLGAALHAGSKQRFQAACAGALQ